MQLLVIRHGVAEDKETFEVAGQDDSLRPLTREGRWKMEHVAKGLCRLLPSVNLIATSPFTRARQTADIVADAYGKPDVEALDALTPDGKPQSFMTWLRARGSDDRVAAVGHEPHLGSLVSWMVTGEAVEDRFALRKGGACLLVFDQQPRMGRARLVWFLPPSLLRRVTE